MYLPILSIYQCVTSLKHYYYYTWNIKVIFILKFLFMSLCLIIHVSVDAKKTPWNLSKFDSYWSWTVTHIYAKS